MKKHILVLVVGLLMSFTFTRPAQAALDGRVVGAGFVLGSPTALTMKYWMDPVTAIDGGLAFATGNYFMLFGDYLYHFPGVFGYSNRFVSKLIPYVGGGAVLAFTSGDRTDDDRYLGKKSGSMGLGFRVPLGIEWINRRPDIGVYLELVPGISLFPATSGFIQGGLGARYYF